MNFYISLTHACELRCSYCYSGEKFAKSIDLKTLNAAINFILHQARSKSAFGFFGGEPLLEWEKLQYATKKIETLAPKFGITFSKTLTTNGLLLDKEKLLWLKEHNFFLALSIDGNESMHNIHRVYPNKKGSFKKVKQALMEAIKLYDPKRLSTITVVTPQNIEYLADSIRFLHQEMGVKRIRISIDYFSNWDHKGLSAIKEFEKIKNYLLMCYRNNKDIYLDFIDEKIKAFIQRSCFDCKFGEFKLGIAPSGRIYPCERLIGEDRGDLAIGTVQEGIDGNALAKIVANRGNKNKECQNCAYKIRCINSCGCTNYYLSGDIALTGATLCFFQKLFIDTADELANILYEEKNKLFLEKFYY